MSKRALKYLLAASPMPVVFSLSFVFGGPMRETGLNFVLGMLAGAMVLVSVVLALVRLMVFAVSKFRRVSLPTSFGLQLTYVLSTWGSILLFRVVLGIAAI